MPRDIKTAISEFVANPTIRSKNQGMMETVGFVVEADESKNLCKVIYLDNNGAPKTAINCMVDLRNGPTGWFPKMQKKGDRNTAGQNGQKDMPKVLFKPDGVGSGTVLSPYTEQYEAEIKSKLKYKNDIMSNGDPGLVGGQII